MEEIKEELTLLEKSFPFIKFSFTPLSEDYVIWINNQSRDYTNYRLFYNSISKHYVINLYYNTQLFSEYLDQFIWGLIRWNLY